MSSTEPDFSQIKGRIMQVITVSPDGTLSGLQVKPGKGVDLTSLGHAEVRRVSEIIWDDTDQMWFVQIIAGPLAGKKITLEAWEAAGLQFLTSPLCLVNPEGVFLFKDYDTAVAAEVKYLDTMRLAGTF